MEDHNFDRLTLALADRATRRGVLRTGMALAGAALGLGGLRFADARRLLATGYPCIRDSACASGYCAPPDATGRRRCACTATSGCAPGQSCVDGVCCTPTDCVLAWGAWSPCIDGQFCRDAVVVTPAVCGGGCPPLRECISCCLKDDLLNGNETDVDCGGGYCPPCANGKACMMDSDCQSGNCFNNVCVNPA